MLHSRWHATQYSPGVQLICRRFWLFPGVRSSGRADLVCKDLRKRCRHLFEERDGPSLAPWPLAEPQLDLRNL